MKNMEKIVGLELDKNMPHGFFLGRGRYFCCGRDRRALSCLSV